jgi:SRSO17 transposase
MSAHNIKKSIRTHSKRLAEHEAKLKDPVQYFSQWDTMPEGYKNRINRRWNIEIRNFKAEIELASKELERRGQHDK